MGNRPDWSQFHGLLRSTNLHTRRNSRGRKSVVENYRRKVLRPAIELARQDNQDGDFGGDLAHFVQSSAVDPRAEEGGHR